MGFFRIISRSSKFAVRVKKRFIPLLLIYALIAGFVGALVDNLDSYQTSDFLDQRGVYIEQAEEFSVTGTQGSALMSALSSATLEYSLDDIQMFKYAQLDNQLRIYSFDLSRPWLHPNLNPDIVKSGSFPSTAREALVPMGDIQKRNSTNGVVIESTIAVGSEFTFTTGSGEVTIRVSGIMDPSDYVGSENDDLWFFVDDSTFNDILDLYGMDPETDTFIHSMAIPIVIEGSGIPLFDIPTNKDYENVADLEQTIQQDFLPDTATYGNFNRNAETSPIDVKQKNRAQALTILGLAVGGGALFVFIFGMLITRFRKREIAILKAMGYSRGTIQTSLVTEIFTDAIIGFTVGMGLIQSVLFYMSDFAQSTLFRPVSVWISFLIVVLISLPGTFIITWRSLGVSPMAIFRDK